MGKEGAANLVSLLSKSLEPASGGYMHNNDRIICSCGYILLSEFMHVNINVHVARYIFPAKFVLKSHIHMQLINVFIVLLTSINNL